MTRKKWVVFAIVQLLGCLAFIGDALAFSPYEGGIGTALWFIYRYLLLPGNLIGGALLSTFNLYLPYWWYLEFVLLAVALNAGFGMLCAAAYRVIREHISGARPHRFAIAFLATTVVFAIVNIVHYHVRPATCSDCFFPHGLPFHLYHEGGFAGERQLCGED